MRQFREGGCNVLVATCVCEEGLDVGSVDLILCFDTSTASPVRLVQRCGRTGRERGGKVFILVTEGREHQTLMDCMRRRDGLNAKILQSKEVANNLYKANPRMMPHDLTPVCQKMFITVAQKTDPKDKKDGDKAKKISKMRIKTFCKMVDEYELKPLALRDTTVAVDGQNFFFQTYTSAARAGLASTYGVEADRYTRHLRNYLAMFNKANVKCYFLFKGGHEDIFKHLNRNYTYDGIHVPVLSKEVFVQIINDMGFEYAVCEYECKRDLIEIAQTLNCPVISFDIEFCFSGVPYIPSSKLTFNECDNTIHCGRFILADFLKNHELTAEKLAVFIVLRNERIFSEDIFSDLFKYLKAPPGPWKRNEHLLKWLSKSSNEHISATISKFISADTKKTFCEEETKVLRQIERRESGGLGAACLLERGAARVARADPRWFAKGVAQGHIAIDYIDLYRSKHLFGAHPIEGFDNAKLVALDIIYYAYDLLTDFKNDGFTFAYEVDPTIQGRRTMNVPRTYNIGKPVYEAEVCVFENGWGCVGELGLLEHFARSALRLESLRGLERAPGRARLLLLALLYWSQRRPAAPAAVPAAAILSHVMLDVVNDRADMNNIPKFPFERKPILDSTTDKSSVTEADCNIAAAIMREYFIAGGGDVDRKLLYSLVEFQQCLSALAALNALCGAPLPAPVWSRTYNATLAYNLLRAAQPVTELVHFLDDLLSPAPTVYAFFNGLLETYQDLHQY